MKIKVGQIPYLNSEAFYHHLGREEFELYPMVPSLLAPAAEKGEIDTGPIPIVDCFRLEDRFKPVGQFCIATSEKAQSILLFSKEPISELGGTRIGITDETSTSKELLKVLLTHRYEIEPKSYEVSHRPEEGNDAFLLIGDAALRNRFGVLSFPYMYDLGAEWYQWTNLPFVFARWIIRNDIDEKTVTFVENVLHGSLDEGMDHIYHTNEPKDKLRMRPRDVVEYIQGFRYWAGAEEHKAMNLFRKYLNTSPL